MHRVYFLIFVCLFFIIGCNSVASSAIEDEGEDQPNEIENNEELNETQVETGSENDYLMEVLNNYKQALRILEEETDVVRNHLHLFSLDKIKKGDELGELIVTDMKIENVNGFRNQLVAFEGIFEVEGYLVLNHGGIGWKYLFVIEEDLRSIPHSFHNLEEGQLVITISNEAELEEAIGEKAAAMNNNGRLKLTALFKNYNYIYAENADLISNMVFDTLMSVDDM